MNLIESPISIYYPSAVLDASRSRTQTGFASFNYAVLDSNIIPSEKDHEQLLFESLRVAKFWALLCVPFSVYASMRWYVWILYAQSLGQHNETTLAFVVYACYFVQGFSSMFWAWMGDKYRYDTVATVLAITNVLAVAIESIAPTFNILLTGTMLLSSCRGILALILAFVATYLPNDLAIKYTSYIYAIAATAYLIGPVASGVIVHFSGYRTVYRVCACVLALSVLYIFTFISESQKALEMKQMRMKALYVNLATIKSNDTKIDTHRLLCENNQFPVCIERYGFIEQRSAKASIAHSMCNSVALAERLMDKMDENDDIDNTIILDANEQETDVSFYTWFMMTNITISNACLIGIEGIVSTYYLVYCKKEFNDSIIVSTMQIALFVSLFVVSSVATPPLFKCCYKRMNVATELQNKSYNVEYCVLFIGHLINIPLWLYIWQRVQQNNIIWALMIIAGIGLGFTNMTQEIMLLEIQPKQHAGKISGAKTMARMFLKAFGCLAVGVLWTRQVYWFLWVMGYMYVISLSLTFVMFFTQKTRH
eukprot:118252_1